MAILQKKCPYCGKVAKEVSSQIFGDSRIVKLECEHSTIEAVVKKSRLDFESLDGKEPFQFQKKTIELLEANNGRGIVAHEVGLGKTVCFSGYLRLHPEALPALIIVKASLVVQTFNELVRWTGYNKIQVMRNGKDEPLDIFDIFVCSYDLVEKLWPKFEKIGLKMIVTDECQLIKNSEAKRTQAVRKLAKNVPYFIATSATPIKNNAVEYFPILNLVDPVKFYSLNGFVGAFVDTYKGYGESVKFGGIKPWAMDRWKKLTENMIFRYTRDEVMPDLPKVQRNYRYSELAGTVEEEYRKAMAQFAETMDDDSMKSSEKNTNLLGMMMRMRHLTGISKVGPTIEFIEEFLASCDRKIVVFIHHKNVKNLLELGLAKLCDEYNIGKPLFLSADLNQDEKGATIKKFRDDPASRIMVASTQSAGEGLNLQFCSDAVLVERQFNPANEEQAEGRFTRIGSEATHINFTTMVCVGTIDEYFAEIVEKKRGALKSALDHESYKWDESSIMQELAEILNTKGRAKWKLPV